MSNKCDLEETKHLAIQKFLEYAKTPGDWRRYPKADYDRCKDGDYRAYSDALEKQGMIYHKASKFTLDKYGRDEIKLAGKTIWELREPAKSHYATLKSGRVGPVYEGRLEGWEDTRVFKPITKAQQAKYEAAVEAWKVDEVRLAVKSLRDHFVALDNERECEKMRKDMGLKPINPEVPYHINNGYDPGTQSAWLLIKDWWKGLWK